MDGNPMRPITAALAIDSRALWRQDQEGSPGASWPVTGKRRCRMHGGAPGSGAPTGERTATITTAGARSRQWPNEGYSWSGFDRRVASRSRCLKRLMGKEGEVGPW